MTDDRLLGIYLNDHYAGFVAARELAKRSIRNNRGTPLGEFLTGLLADIEADGAVLAEVMAAVGTRQDPIKRATAWSAEKVGRLKLNGSLAGYSDLSRLEELEGLSLGVHGKLGLWDTLSLVAGSDRRLAGFEFSSLADRAKRQRAAIERFRLPAAARAFGGEATTAKKP